MKNIIKFLCLFLVTGVYCHVIGDYSDRPETSDIFSKEQQSAEQNYLAAFSFKFIGQTPFGDYSVNSIKGPDPGAKKPFNGHATIAQALERLLKSSFSQYTSSSRNFLIVHRKTVLIFPFHYFW